MSNSIKENIGFCKIDCEGSSHNGAEGTVIKMDNHGTWNSVLVCINTGLTQGAAVWFHEDKIIWQAQ